MVTSKKFWDKTARKYSDSKISDVASYERKIAETQQLLNPEMMMFEFGCGTGSTAIRHAPYVKHIHATDLSDNMIQIAREKAADAGVSNITFTSSTLAEVSVKDASIDVVLGLNILHLIDDRKAAIAKVKRILKPGGLFISSTACMGGSPVRFIKLIAPLARWVGLMPEFYVFTRAELKEEIVSSGFDIENEWFHGKSVESSFIVASSRST